MALDSQPKRVLVVDDEPNAAMVIAASMKRLGQEFLVETAHSGHEALAKAQQTQYAVLVTDYMMPGMNGLDLAQAVRQVSPGTKVVLVTAYDTQQLKLMALSGDMDEEVAAKVSIIGALKLYLDFINLFLLLLRVMGGRR